MIEKRPFRYFLNRNHGMLGIAVLPESGYARAKAETTTWPGYAPTPLVALDAIAKSAGVARLQYKDEAARFGLASFKALGGAYAVMRVLQAELAKRDVAREATSADLIEGRYKDATSKISVCCATDGNHGRSVAWGAERFGAACVIFVHETVSQGRRDAIAKYGAAIRVVPGNYDDAVREAQKQAEANGWFVVSDTSDPG